MLPEATLQVLGCLRTQRFEPERGNARAGKASGTGGMWATMTDTGPLPCGGRRGERALPADAGTLCVRASGLGGVGTVSRAIRQYGECEKETNVRYIEKVS
jgi:hypothetical protein